MLKRPRLKVLHDPDFRRDFFFRVGFPLLGALVAMMLALAITQI